jgi:hypothetical protein
MKALAPASLFHPVDRKRPKAPETIGEG